MPAILAVAWLTPAPRRGTAWRLHPMGVLRFAGFFLRGSLFGGLDVAARVSTPRPRVAPGLVRYPWRLPDDGPARPLFALCVNLLPGTLVARFDDDTILVHALDTGAPVADELAALEQAVAGALSLQLRAPPSGHG